MNITQRITDRLRSGRDRQHNSATSPASARWRQEFALMSVQRDVDEAADEQTYVDAELARSRDYAAKLDADVAAATADGCAAVALELHEELSQTYAFLAELAEVRATVATERNRLSSLRKRMADQLAESDRPAMTVTDGTAADTRVLVDRAAAETMRMADEEARLEASV